MSNPQNNIVELLCSRISIQEYIQQYVTLQKRGNNYLGLCPFHTEKTPSFTVSAQKQFFHCFGCKESGSVLQFAMKYHGITFREAIEKLASYAGITLDQNTYKKLSAQELLVQQLKELNYATAQIYHKELSSLPDASSYLEKRSITTQTIQHFMIGGVPSGQHFLSNKLDISAFHEKVLRSSNLFYENASKHYEDRFRNKVSFPIQDVKGNVIAFGFRVLDNSLPKYINSAETPLFKKRQTLYGLYQAYQDIKEKNSVYITEGYFDVIALHQFQITNTVATLGTAISNVHIQTLKPLTENLILLFDGDKAGRTAALKALWMCLGENIAPQMIICPSTQDPYDIAVMYQDRTQGWLTSNTLTWQDFLLSQIKQEENPIQQQKMVKEYLATLEKINPFMSQEFAYDVSEYFNIPINTFLKQKTQSKTYEQKRIIKKPQYKEASPQQDINKEEQTEYLLVCLCLKAPNDFYSLQEQLHIGADFFNTPKAKELFLLFSETPGFDFSSFILQVPSDLGAIITKLQPIIENITHYKKSILDCYYSLKLFSLDKEEKRLQETIQKEPKQENIIPLIQELEMIQAKKSKSITFFKKNFEL